MQGKMKTIGMSWMHIGCFRFFMYIKFKVGAVQHWTKIEEHFTISPLTALSNKTALCIVWLHKKILGKLYHNPDFISRGISFFLVGDVDEFDCFFIAYNSTIKATWFMKKSSSIWRELTKIDLVRMRSNACARQLERRFMVSLALTIVFQHKFLRHC